MNCAFDFSYDVLVKFEDVYIQIFFVFYYAD